MGERNKRGSISWRRYCGVVGAAVVVELLLASALVLLANPYGNLPPLLFSSHVIMDTNQRFQYPAIARSGRYDSIVIGTSTARLLRPGALERVFGGRFANLAMDSARAWEQYRIATLFGEHTAYPRTLLVGVDVVWCDADADTQKTTYRGFPEWMFDNEPWNDFPHMLNKRAVEIAGRRIANALGLNPDRIPFDGYEIFMPDESRYDLAKARDLIGPVPVAEQRFVATSEERRQWRFPALEWLETLLDGKWQNAVIVIMPVHVAAQPAQGSPSAAHENECKARLTALAKRRGVPLVDFRIGSGITTRDENYWDSLHYRVPVAERIVHYIGQALATGQDDPAGKWRVLAPQTYKSADGRRVSR
jgi:hypothetical protein